MTLFKLIFNRGGKIPAYEVLPLAVCGGGFMYMLADFWVILLIAFGLAMDCFAVSLSIGSSPTPCTARSIFRVSFHFGLFQGGMTLLGWLLGNTVVNLIAGIDHWIAMLLLAWVGRHMIFEGFRKTEEQPLYECSDPSRGGSLVMLSIATSIDALGVGLSLALLKVNVAAASLLIGLVSLVLSIIGMLGGKRLNWRFGRKVEVLGGFVLVFIGLRIIVTHLFT